MNTNREIKIAIAVGIIMITGCIVAFIVSNSKKSTEVTLDLHIYKHMGDTSNNTGKYYECIIETDKLPELNDDFKRIMNLKDSSRVTSMEASLEGKYKVVSGTNFIAFDGDGSNYVYRGDTTGIYVFPSDMYSTVVSACSYITDEVVLEMERQQAESQAKQQQEQQQEQKETKQKETKKTNTTSKKTNKTNKTNKK